MEAITINEIEVTSYDGDNDSSVSVGYVKEHKAFYIDFQIKVTGDVSEKPRANHKVLDNNIVSTNFLISRNEAIALYELLNIEFKRSNIRFK